MRRQSGGGPLQLPRSSGAQVVIVNRISSVLPHLLKAWDHIREAHGNAGQACRESPRRILYM
jgi:hypothetical protein